MTDVLAVLQARSNSSRLPGKVLKEICGEPMILKQIKRLRNSKLIDELVVATSDESSDDELANILAAEGVKVFRGSLGDVLDRFYKLSLKFTGNHIVRITADCPLADWNVIDDVIRLHIEKGNDYTSNINPPSFPDGLDVEIFKLNVLKEAWEYAKTAREREHVTPYMRDQSKFKVGNLSYQRNISNLRWTVDYQTDFDFVEKVFSIFKDTKKDFTMQDILKLSDDYS